MPKKPVPGPKEKPAKSTRKLLFILKAHGTYSNPYAAIKPSSGLLNSARFVVDMLNAHGVTAEIEIVNDNNDIDRVVTAHRPTDVVIEALWVVPEKFEVLSALHPNVNWVIRVHSEIPFLAQEGIALEWLAAYSDMVLDNVTIAFNSDRTYNDFINLYRAAHIPNPTFLPNFYPVAEGSNTPYRLGRSNMINVGSFGAVRPLKNQLIQAVAAVRFAEQRGLNLDYHINASRIEQKGDPVLKNIRALFRDLPSQYQLVEHDWLERSDFIKLVRSMDIGLQMSFTESFNIIVADFVSNGVPVVTSPEVRWVDEMFHAEATDIEDIVSKMNKALFWKRFAGFFNWNEAGLKSYCKASQKTWLKYFQS